MSHVSAAAAVFVSAVLAVGLTRPALAQDVFDDDAPEGTPITGNELEATGRTLGQGSHTVSILGRYRYGATDWLQVGSTAYEWAAGPNLHVAFQPFANDQHAVSIEIDTLASYSFDTTFFGAMGMYSYGGETGSRLNAGIGVGLQSINGLVEPSSSDPNFPDPPALDLSRAVQSVPLHVGYDHAFNDVQMLRVWFTPYVVYSSVNTAGATVTNAGVDILRELEALALEWDADPPVVPDVMPMPYLRLYWLL